MENIRTINGMCIVLAGSLEPVHTHIPEPVHTHIPDEQTRLQYDAM